MALIAAFIEILHKPTIGAMVMELVVFSVPIWIAVVVGVLVGWAWKPKWANLNRGGEPNKSGMVPQFYASMPSFTSLKLQLPNPTWISDIGFEKSSSSLPSLPAPDDSLTKLETDKSSIVNEDDLRHLYRLVEEKDGGPPWIKMMDKSTPNMSYQAWRRDPETGPPQYRSRTVYEDAAPETLRDFFWDDEFRLQWDDMLARAETLEECPKSGTMMVQWVRKFPFFCSDREYIIGRRIWNCGRTYYCVTKGVPCPSVPRRDKPRRVDLYYSSWCIRAAESKRDGRMTACEVLLFHHEDMGIPWEIAKLGIRQGMWGAVKKIDPGLRAYQKYRSSGAPLSRSASMAQINTKVSPDFLESDETASSSTSEVQTLTPAEKPAGKGMPKMLIFAGAMMLAYTLDRGLLTKAAIFGVARRFANNNGRRL